MTWHAWLTPARRRGVEWLDDPSVPEDTRARALDDVARSNALFGGWRAVRGALRAVGPLPPAVVIVDVGVGAGDLAVHVRATLARRGVTATMVGVDREASVSRRARARVDGAVTADALRLPLRDGCADLVVCSQLAHHFEAFQLHTLLAELQRVSRGWVVVSDLRRSRVAASLFWLAATALRFHPATRHDGVVSVFRGFTAAELESLVRDATGVAPTVRRSAFWRLSATWPATGRAGGQGRPRPRDSGPR